MKRIIITIFAIILTFAIPFSCSASVTSSNPICIGEATVEFDNNSVFSVETQYNLAYQLLANDPSEQASTTYNVLCTLFGHSTTVESVTVIEHCVSDTQPKCLRTIQEITACTRCEELISTNIISTKYVYCCE